MRNLSWLGLKMRIASWNVNSVRARIEQIAGWTRRTEPDVLLLQEIKCRTDDFPRLEFESMGYVCHVAGQKSYNGVALLSRQPPTAPLFALPGDSEDSQARYLEATIGGARIASVYAPNGNPINSDKYDYKLAWMRRLKAHIASMLKAGTPFVLGGDFNVIPEARDVYNPTGWENDALFHPRTRASWREILNLGVTEAFRALNPSAKEAYTFWDYQAGAWPRNLGLRIDHFLLSPDCADRLESCVIDRAPRGADKASDHTPIMIELAFKPI